MHKEIAVRLLQEHAEEIADLIVAQARQVAPSMGLVEADVGRQSVSGMMRSLAQVLDGAPPSTFLAVVETLVQIRAAVGVTREDFVAASYTYLPCVRWVFMEKAKSPLEGVYAYEEVESVAIPLLGKLASVIAYVDNEKVMVDSELFEGFSPFAPDMFSEDEDTVTDRRARHGG